MRFLILALAIAGCSTTPDRFGSTEPVIVKVEDVTFAVRVLPGEASSEIYATDAFIRQIDYLEDVVLHRRAIESVTGCRAVNQTIDLGTMLADLQC